VRGLGLGLNLVAAIVKLHEFRLTIVPGAGCVIEIASPDRAADWKADAVETARADRADQRDAAE
jgi:hypothetical protein